MGVYIHYAYCCVMSIIIWYNLLLKFSSSVFFKFILIKPNFIFCVKNTFLNNIHKTKVNTVR